MFFLRLAGVLVGGASSSESEAEVMIAFLRLVVVALLAGVLVFFARVVLGVEGTVLVPAMMALLFLRILEKCSVKAFLVGGGPKESARGWC
jgi:uncharacterized membrane protein